jgi:hypothetical protein
MEQRDYFLGWWHVLTLFEGGTIEGYKSGETEDGVLIRQVVFRKDDEPGQTEVEVPFEIIRAVSAYQERPAR